MKSKLIILLFFLMISNLNAQTTIEGEYKLIDNQTINSKSYAIYAKSNASKFQLKIKYNATEEVTGEYINTISSNEFYSQFESFIIQKFDTALVKGTLSDNEKNNITQLINKIQIIEREKSDAARTEAENLIYKVDEEKDQYSAQLVLNSSTTIPYKVTTYKLKKAKKEAIRDQMITDIKSSLSAADTTMFKNMILKEGYTHLLGLAENDYTTFSKDTTIKKFTDIEKLYNSLILEQEQRDINQYCKKYYKKITTKGLGSLKVKNALVQFFNNKASSIYIEAEITDGGVTETLIFINSEFSVPLRYFNNYNSAVSALSNVISNDGYRKEISVDYNDLFDYKAEQYFNYSIANRQVHLSNEEGSKHGNSVKIIQRRFLDFFTGIIYSDVMGFNTENSNSLLNAQAKLLIPLNLRNFGKWSLGRQFITTANIALDNSFQNENRYIDIKDEDSFSNFDLLKKNNLYGKFALDVISHEAKGWFTYISLGYNATFYRTGLRYTETLPDAADTVTERQLLSVGHGPFLNFEIRPQSNFGADVTFSLEDLNYSDITSIGSRNFNGDIIEDIGKDHLVMPYNLINIEANFYWLLNPEKSKGGIYAKLGSYFNTDTNAVFPQLMVGYATNLTSFVNRFKPDAATKGKK